MVFSGRTGARTGRLSRATHVHIRRVIGIVIVVLILLVLAAPTLLSSGPVVSGILAQVNKQLLIVQ